MKLLSIINTIEDLIYDLSLLFYLVPKTLWKMIKSPRWAYHYVQVECKKDLSDRYDEYVSPILFWVIIGILPYIMILKITGFGANELKQFLGIEIEKIPVEIQVILIALFFVCGPLGFSIGINIDRKKTISRLQLKRVFSTQCYCFAPALIASIPAFVIIATLNGKIISTIPLTLQIIFWVSFSISLIWLAISQCIVLKLELKISILKAFGKFIAYTCVSFGLVYLAELFIFGALVLIGSIKF